MAVSVSTAGEFSVGSPKPLFRLPRFPGFEIAYQYDVSADGQRFVVVEDVEDEQANRPSIHIVRIGTMTSAGVNGTRLQCGGFAGGCG